MLLRAETERRRPFRLDTPRRGLQKYKRFDDEEWDDMEDCEDEYEECEEWADMGECEEDSDYMHEYCPESCDMCRFAVPEG